VGAQDGVMRSMQTISADGRYQLFGDKSMIDERLQYLEGLRKVEVWINDDDYRMDRNNITARLSKAVGREIEVVYHTWNRRSKD